MVEVNTLLSSYEWADIFREFQNEWIIFKGSTAELENIKWNYEEASEEAANKMVEFL